MTDGTSMPPTRRAALVAGLLYFSTHITSVAAVIAYRSALGPDGTPVSAAAGDRVLLGVALEVALALGVLGTGVVLLPVLRPHGPALAHGFSALRTLEAAVIAAGTLPMVALVWLHSAGTTGAGTAGAEAAALVAAHEAAFLVGQGLIISVNTLVLASVLRISGLVPRWISTLGLIGGAGVLVGNTAQLFGAIDRSGALAGLLAVPAFAFEICFAGYLVLRGFRTKRTAVDPMSGPGGSGAAGGLGVDPAELLGGQRLRRG